jgi:hypothetical protein
MERSSVELAQVVLPEKLKEDAVSCVERFMTGRKNGALERLDNFFGYGTGLPILFHGPSGTGKTMLAKGLAHHLDVPLLTLNLQEMEENHFDYSFILSFLFKEATLMGAIVFLDECDDIFCGENNARLSRALLLELEKSRCITILATNRPVELDPAMERRLVLKAHFTRPDALLRLRMWQALTPSTLPLSKEIDLHGFAERYLFTGGLIKNTVFMAANAAIALGKNEITRDLLEHAAGQQSQSLTDVNGLCRVYAPDRTLDSLDLHNRQKEELRNTAIAWRRLHNEELRLNMLISTTHIDTGIKAAEGLAASCGLKIRAFDYDKVISMSEENRVIDPVSQRKVTPMDYAFSAGSGDVAMILFVDHEGFMNRILDKKEEDGKGVLLSELTSRMRNHRGLFCMVAPKLNQSFPPVEFNLHFHLEYPPVEMQIRQWERHLAGIPEDDDRLVDLVEQYPMHTAEIDFIAGQAVTQSIIQGMDGKPSLKSVQEVIARYRRKSGAPLLFGKER